MQLINQHTKQIFEDCKQRAIDFGLNVDCATLEYIVSGKDFAELSSKVMIPTMYHFWLDDVRTFSDIKQYEVYPHSAYETVINSRPGMSFYLQDNPDWLNCMIAYHVLGHQDFFRSNKFYEKTWNDDFVGQSLANKRTINELRIKHGRWVDYVIEFSRSLDNILFPTYYDQQKHKVKNCTDFFFDIFIQTEINYSEIMYTKWLNKFNKMTDIEFKNEVISNFPDFITLYEDYKDNYKNTDPDILSWLMDNSPFLNKKGNEWMLTVISIVKETALYFEPQRRTKIMNEGWASLIHDELFRADPHIVGFETDYARVNSFVTSVPKVGLNPYAIGMRLFEHIKNNSNKGKYSIEFDRILDKENRKYYDKHKDTGWQYIRDIMINCNDSMFINSFITQDFVEEYNLAVIGTRLVQYGQYKEYYIKSKKAADYKQMLLDTLTHPPLMCIKKVNDKKLELKHKWEGVELYQPYVQQVLRNILWLWGNDSNIELETKFYDDDHKTFAKYYREEKK